MYEILCGGDALAKVVVNRIRGRILGRGNTHLWGDPHPFGWERIHKAVSFLLEALDEAGLTGREKSSSVFDVKEKFGKVRIYTYLGDADRKVFFDIVGRALEMFPGLEMWLDSDICEDAEVVFEGSLEECRQWCNKRLKEQEGAASLKQVSSEQLTEFLGYIAEDLREDVSFDRLRKLIEVSLRLMGDERPVWENSEGFVQVGAPEGSRKCQNSED